MNFDDMLLDPADAFNSPEQVLDTEQLTREQKVQILRRWDDDTRQLLTAQSEGMTSRDGASDVLKRIQQALEKLDAAASDT